MSATIMLVEDEQPIREMLRYSLEKHEHTVIEAESSRQALEILMTNRPDLLVVDWMMPGESGVELVKRLKKDEVLAEIPTMMLTARVEEMDKVKGLEISANHLKSKSEGEVFATARPIHKGRTTHLWEIRVEDEDGKLISLCKLTTIVLPK